MTGGPAPYAPAYGGVTVRPADRERRHTRYFLERISGFSPVFLDTEVDMTGVRAHRAAALASGTRLSNVTYVLHAAARVLAVHPEANAAYRGGLRPRTARNSSVNGKLTLDKTISGRRVVLSAVLPDLHHADLADIQKQVEHYRDGNPEIMPEFGGVRSLHRLPDLVAALAFRATVAPLRTRAATMGTFAVTSLGHRPVDGFHSVGGTTVTLGVGRVLDRPVAVAGKVGIAPLMRLNLAFDHRVVDGAEAADVLAEIKERLEAYHGSTAPPSAPASRAGHGDPLDLTDPGEAGLETAGAPRRIDTEASDQ